MSLLSIGKTNTNPLFGRSKTALSQRQSPKYTHQEDVVEVNIHNKILAPGEISQLELTGQATVYQVGAEEIHIIPKNKHMPFIQSR